MPRAPRSIDRCPMCEVQLVIGPSRKVAICPRCNTSFDGNWPAQTSPQRPDAPPLRSASRRAGNSGFAPSSAHPLWFMRAQRPKDRVIRFIACLLVAVIGVVVVHLLFRPAIKSLDEAQQQAEQAADEAAQINAELQDMLKQMQQR